MSQSGSPRISSLLSGVFKAVWPELKKLHAERSAVKTPPKVPINTFIGETLERLGSIEEHSEWWKRLLQKLKASYTRPDFFEKPHVKRWLKEEQVRRDFNELVKCRLSGRTEDEVVVERLRLAYEHASDYNARLADGPIETVLAVLGASLWSMMTSGEKVLLEAVNSGFESVLTSIRSLTNSYQIGLPHGLNQFKKHYLGTPTIPKPFGGRDKQLKALNDWLVDESAPSYLLLTAEAGRGKSCLLAHWLEQLPDGWVPVFMPISIRFELGTSRQFYSSLAVQFANILDEELPSNPNDHEDVYKEYIHEAMERTRGHRIVLVVDGLDEAVGWRIGEFLSPLNCLMDKVVVSCRIIAGRNVEHWLTEIGWNTQEARTELLPGLDRDGVHDVLIKMGAPLDELGRDVIREIHRLSEGDPLIIGFYVEALWTKKKGAAQFKPEELSEFDAGFGPFFSIWMRKHHGEWENSASTERLRAILALLSCACGPLGHDDIESLLEYMNVKTTGFTSGDLIPIERFVIGGKGGGGYSFSHPKLSDFIRSEYFNDGKWINKAEVAFLKWGSEVVSLLNRKLVPYLKCPVYLTNHYVQHLAAANESTSVYMALTEEGWMRAREARDGSLNKYSGDISVVWAAIKNSRRTENIEESYGDEFRCALIQSSIFSIGTDIIPDLIVAAVEYGLMSLEGAVHNLLFVRSKHEYNASLLRALLALGLDYSTERNTPIYLKILEAIKGIKELKERAKAYVAFAPHVPDEDKAAFISTTLKQVMNIQSAVVRAELVFALYPYLSSEESTSSIIKTIQFALEVEPPRRLVKVVSTLAPILPSQLRSEVVGAVIRFEGAKWKAKALVSLAPYLSGAEKRLVIDSALGMASPVWSVKVFASLLPYLEGEEKDKVLFFAQDNIIKADVSLGRAESQIAIASYLSKKDREKGLISALNIIKRAAIPLEQSSILVSIASQLPEHYRGETVDVALKIQSAPALAGLIPIASDEDRQKILNATNEFNSPATEAEVLVSLSPYLSGDKKQKVLKAIKRIGDANHQVLLLIEYAKHLPKKNGSEVLASTLESALMVKDAEARAKAIITLAKELPEEKRVTGVCEAMKIKATMDDPIAVVDYSCLLPQANRQLAIDISSLIESPRLKAEALVGVAQHLPEKDKGVALEKAFVAISEVKEKEEQTDTLIALAPHLSIEGKVHAFEAALGIKGASDRFDALLYIAPHLPEEAASKALDSVLRIKSQTYRGLIIAALAQNLSEESVGKALDAVNSMTDDRVQRKAQEALANRLAKSGKGTARVVSTRKKPRMRYSSEKSKRERHRFAYLRDSERYPRYEFKWVHSNRMSQLLKEHIAIRKLLEFFYEKGITADDLDRFNGMAPVADLSIRFGYIAEKIDNLSEWREEALYALVTNLSNDEIAEGLKIVSKGMDAEDKLSEIGEFSANSSEWWSALIESVASSKRSDSLEIITNDLTLKHVLKMKNKQNALKAMVAAICDSGRWWP